jgi:hypothetical protein
MKNHRNHESHLNIFIGITNHFSVLSHPAIANDLLKK